MSIQASINQALSSVELALLRTGAVPTSKREYVDENAGEAPEEAKDPETKKANADPTNDTAEQQTSQNEAPEAATNPAAQIITNGNMAAGAIASGRVEARQQQRRQFIEESQARLEWLKKKGKSPGSREARKLKKDLARTRRELVKEES